MIDQTRTMLGEWRGLSASLDLVSNRSWSAEDTFTVHFKTQAGCTGLLHSSIATYGPPTVASRISGPKGTLTIAGDTVSVTDAAGTRALEMPPELAHPAPKPPDSDLLVTAYDMLHSAGIDLAPFAQLFRAMGDTILGRPPHGIPAPATFADGVALQRILDAVRRSSEQEGWEAL